MPYLHQYDYIFAICIMAAGLDAYNIGANDVSLHITRLEKWGKG